MDLEGSGSFRDLEEYTRRAHTVGPGPQRVISDV